MDPYTFAPVMRVTVELPIEIIDQVLTPSEDEIKMILGNGLYGVIKNERSWSFTREGVIAFAQAIIEERESIGEPVAWIDHEGGLYHYKLYETYLPLYRHPPHKRKLTDEEIFEVVREASRG